MNDLLDRLAALPDAEPSQMRADRVRARARRRLTRPRHAAPGLSSPRGRAPLLWLAAGVSAAYLAKVLAVAVEGMKIRSAEAAPAYEPSTATLEVKWRRLPFTSTSV